MRYQGSIGGNYVRVVFDYVWSMKVLEGYVKFVMCKEEVIQALFTNPPSLY